MDRASLPPSTREAYRALARIRINKPGPKPGLIRDSNANAMTAESKGPRDFNRGIRRVVRKLDRRLEVMEKRRQARERFRR